MRRMKRGEERNKNNHYMPTLAANPNLKYKLVHRLIQDKSVMIKTLYLISKSISLRRSPKKI